MEIAQLEPDKRGLIVKVRDLKLAEELPVPTGDQRFTTTEAFWQRFALASLRELTEASLSDKGTARTVAVCHSRIPWAPATHH